MQFTLFPISEKPGNRKANSFANKISNNDRAFHDWYRFVLSFPPHLVRDYIEKFNLKSGQTILDPFCGTGTTLVESKLQGIASIGIEANPMAYFASSVKVDWIVQPDQLLDHAFKISNATSHNLKSPGTGTLRTLPPESFKLLLKDSISPIPLHKSIVLLENIQSHKDERFYKYELLALAKALVCSIGNLHFGPEVGVSRSKKIDAPVIENWLAEIRRMAEDLLHAEIDAPPAVIINSDSRQLDRVLSPSSIDAVFTSPPYPNEKDYTRTTRLESVILGFVKNKGDLKALKNNLLRSNTRNVYKNDDDDIWVSENKEIQAIAKAIEDRRIELGKTSGFERLYGRVTKLYFGGMARHFAELRRFLKPGAVLGYVVGDQASYLQVMIQTGKLFADIAQSLGYELIGIDLFRTRLATATRKQMREEVVILRWPG